MNRDFPARINARTDSRSPRRRSSVPCLMSSLKTMLHPAARADRTIRASQKDNLCNRWRSIAASLFQTAREWHRNDPPVHQPSTAVHSGFVPQVFQDGARPLDVAQVAVLLGWTKDVVRASCERGDLAHTRDHLNAYRIPCVQRHYFLTRLVSPASWDTTASCWALG